jgi:hypothetical protein
VIYVQLTYVLATRLNFNSDGNRFTTSQAQRSNTAFQTATAQCVD